MDCIVWKHTTVTGHVVGERASDFKPNPTDWYAGFLHFQQISNGHNSPAKQFPQLGKTLSRFLRKEVGEMDSHPKKPMFAQDFEHILDTIGIESPAALQRKWMKWQYCDTLYDTTFFEINF